MADEITLNDPDKIEGLDTLVAQTMEPLYWVMEDSFTKGDVKLGKDIFTEFMYAAKYKPHLLVDGLKEGHRKRLKNLTYELFGNTAIKEQKTITIKHSSSAKSLPFKKEADLQIYLADNPRVLSSALGEEVRVTGMEVETDFEYRCDITAESEKTFYPIELKIRQADHAVVSQCNKYCFYFYRKLRYSFYKKIQGIVIANGFCDWSINELRREGIWIFDIFKEGDGVRLSRIH